MSTKTPTTSPPRQATTLDRRRFLKGLGTTMVALPFLEILLDPRGRRPARAANTPPKRYAVLFAGQSTGADDDPVHNLLTPNTVGANYDLPAGLKPLGDLSVQGAVTVVSGLRIPYANGGAIPAGGRDDFWHKAAQGPMLCGVRGTSRDPASRAETSDMIVSKAIAGSSTFKFLAYRTQVAEYGGDLGTGGAISSRDDGKGLYQVQPEISPHAAFSALFNNFTPSNPDDLAQQQALLAQRKSVLDLVDRRTNRLLAALGKADQQRLSQHYDEIRDLERRVAAIPPPTGGTCQKLADPGADPAVGAGYSDEDARARVQCDLIAMAFACDLTRVASLMITGNKSFLQMSTPIGVNTDMHSIGHQLRTSDVAKANAWHVKHFAYLVSKLAASPEGGGSVLDSSALTLHFEGGHGFDPQGGGALDSHSSENMVVLIGGRAGGLKMGQHLVMKGGHPANVLVSAMNAVGVPGDLGEVNGGVPGLI